MNNNNIEDLVLKYLNSGISDSEKKKIESLLEKAGFAVEDLKNLQMVDQQLSTLPLPDPDDNLSNNFYKILANYKSQYKKERNRFARYYSFFKTINYRQIGYSLTVLLLGWVIGFWFTPEKKANEQLTFLTAELRQMKKMMVFTMVNQSSAVERIKAINFIKNFTVLEEDMIRLLLKILNNDSNVNVRLVALQTLVKHADNQTVKQGLINSIALQKSPLLQLELADTMVLLNQPQAVDQLKRLLSKPELPYVIRARIQNNLKLLI